MRLLGALLAAVLLAPAAPAGAAKISLSGSSTARPLVADLAWFYRQERRHPPRFSLVGGGTEAGIADAARGIVDVGLASRAPLPEDPRGLVFTPFASGAVCLVTNRANPLAELTRASVQDLVSGRVSDWSRLGGPAGAIVPASLGVGTGARSVFLDTFVDDETPLAYAPRTFSTAAQIRDFVRATPAAWGYVDLAFTAGLHVVPYEGVPCARASVIAGDYPARRDLAFVTRGEPRGAAARFIAWAQTSRTARRVIAARYVPVGPGR